MKAKRLLGVIAFISFIVVFLNVSFAQRPCKEEETLRGLGGVRVVIESIDPEAERDGLTESLLQTRVELKLRMASIKVFTEEEATQSNAPYLYVQVLTMKHSERPIYAFAIDVELKQGVLLSENPQCATVAPTWEAAGRVGTVGERNVRTICENVEELVDEFINAYLAVNPKQ
jgi:hypothetical protein